MSDWRQEDSPKRTPKSFIPANEVPQLSPKPTGGWKGKKTPVVPASSRSSSRSWTGEIADVEALSASTLGRWLTVVFLAIAAILLTVYFVLYIFRKPAKLPMIIFGVAQYEASPEFIANSYADNQRASFLTANQKNIAAHTFLNVKNDDNALAALNTAEWLRNFKEFSSKTIPSGGPDKKVVAFYINAYATFTAENDLVIHSQESLPFGATSGHGIKLEDVLQNAALVVAKNSIAWVILDLQLPPITTNLNDLDPKWQTATERALAKVEQNDKDQFAKLLVTLPGQDGQQNWLAPEFSSSFFGYYVLRLLEGRFTDITILNNALTVSDFQKLLNERVSNRVSSRRFASQNPVWLPKSKAESSASYRLVTVAQAASNDVTPPEMVQGNLDAIDAQWKTISANKYYRAYRWDPLGYAKVESQLLRLEDVAMTQPAAFARAKDLVEEAWNSLNKPIDSFQVSLIEDKQLDQYFHGKQSNRAYEKIDELVQQLADQFVASNDAVPSFWKTQSPTPEEAAAKVVAPEDQVSPADRPFVVWQFLVAIAAKPNQPAWKQAFTQDRIEQALKYAGETETNWLELHLLNLLVSEVDWDALNPDRPQACAEALVLFSQIQTLATLPEPDVSGWLRQSLEPIEQKFLLGFDYLLANQAKEALQEFRQVATILKPLDPRAKQLASIIEDTHDALHAVPHLLAWLSKEYQFVEEQGAGAVKSQLESLGQLVDLTDEVYSYLKSKPTGSLDGIDQGLFTAGEKLTNQYTSLMQSFDDYLSKKTDRDATGAPSNSPLTFRRERVCLQSPFLSLDARRKLHGNTRVFLNMKIAENVEQKEQKNDRSAMDAIELFLTSVDSERDRWKAIAKSDVRLHWDDQFTAQENELPDASSASALRSELLKRVYWQRCYAAAFGASPSLHARLANAGDGGMPWPWSCAWQSWSLAATNYRLFQVSRLTEASWGNGLFTDSSPNEDFYFYQLAGRYKLQDKIELLEPLGKLAEEFQSQMKESKQASVKRLKSIRANFGDANQSISRGDALIKVDVAADWDAVMQVYLSRPPDKRIPWQRSQPDDRIWVVHLQRDRQTRRQLDTGWKESGPPAGNLAIRGNVRRTQIAWRELEENRSAVELVMSRPIPDGASIQVLSPKEKPPICVLMLIDCSKSMEIQVLGLNEAGTPQLGELFKQVKETAKGVIERLRDIHGREADVSLGLIPFGLKKSDISPQLKNLLIMRPDDFYRTKDFKPLDKLWQDEMEQLIDELRPSGDTPLYDAITFAYDIAKEGIQAKTLIYIFSDGVNFVGEKPPLDSKTLNDVRNAIDKNPNVRLSIFHFDFFETWVALQDADLRARWRRIYEKGTEELESLQKLGRTQYGYYRSDQVQQLMQDSRETIPKSIVTIQSASGNGTPFKADFQPLDSEIPIAQTHLEAVLDVNVEGPFGSAHGVVEAMGGEQLKLTFDALRRRLEFEKFEVSGKIQGKPRGAQPKSILYLKTLTDQLVAANQLSFELNFWNGSQAEFTARPRFIVAELSQSDDIHAGTFVLADYRFMSRTHYPEVRLSEVPWPKSRPPASLRVWVSDTIPAQVSLTSIEPAKTETLTMGSAAVRFGSNGSSIVVEIVYATPPKPKDRIVVLCPDFESSKRTFSDQERSERHEFMLPERLHNQKIDLQFATIGELEEAVKMNKLTEFNFDRIELKN